MTVMKMNMVLGSNVLAGQKIKTIWGWRKIKQITDDGAVVKEGVVKFGDPIFGWKSS